MAFWAAYPRRTGKQPAFRSWLRLDPPSGLQEQILSAIELQKRHTWKESSFIPHPATWLNQQRWEDEIQKGKTWTSSNDLARAKDDGAKRKIELAMLQLSDERKGGVWTEEEYQAKLAALTKAP
jgi:hypothetical protein